MPTDRGPPVRGGGFEPRPGFRDPPTEDFLEIPATTSAPVQAPTVSDELVMMKKYAHHIKHNHEKLAQSVESIEKSLKEQTIALKADLTKFEQTKAAVEGALDKCKGRVKLNVGGVKYETTLTTLTADGDNSMLGSMFSGRHELQTNDEGEVFIDRDGKHFGYILNMLRDASVEVPLKDRAAFQTELCYHGITAKRCQRLIKFVDANGHEASLDPYGRAVGRHCNH